MAFGRETPYQFRRGEQVEWLPTARDMKLRFGEGLFVVETAEFHGDAAASHPQTLTLSRNGKPVCRPEGNGQATISGVWLRVVA